MFSKINFWARKIHRLAMWLIIAIGGFMSFSGFLMHRELEGQSTWFFNTSWLRNWHNQLSTYFSFILWAMILTGFLMWVIPKINQWKAKKQQDTPSATPEDSST